MHPKLSRVGSLLQPKPLCMDLYPWQDKAEGGSAHATKMSATLASSLRPIGSRPDETGGREGASEPGMPGEQQKRENGHCQISPGA